MISMLYDVRTIILTGFSLSFFAGGPGTGSNLRVLTGRLVRLDAPAGALGGILVLIQCSVYGVRVRVGVC